MPDTLVISVSGSRAGAGKTRLIELLLPLLGDCAAIKARLEPTEGLSVIAEDDASESPHKDTGRYLSAGARRAFLITGGAARIERLVERIASSGEFDTVVVESDALFTRIESDLSFFVRADGEPKPGAAICEQAADVVVCAISGGQKQKPCRTNRWRE